MQQKIVNMASLQGRHAQFLFPDQCHPTPSKAFKAQSFRTIRRSGRQISSHFFSFSSLRTYEVLKALHTREINFTLRVSTLNNEQITTFLNTQCLGAFLPGWKKGELWLCCMGSSLVCPSTTIQIPCATRIEISIEHVFVFLPRSIPLCISCHAPVFDAASFASPFAVASECLSCFIEAMTEPNAEISCCVGVTP